MDGSAQSPVGSVFSLLVKLCFDGNPPSGVSGVLCPMQTVPRLCASYLLLGQSEQSPFAPNAPISGVTCISGPMLTLLWERDQALVAIPVCHADDSTFYLLTPASRQQPSNFSSVLRLSGTDLALNKQTELTHKLGFFAGVIWSKTVPQIGWQCNDTALVWPREAPGRREMLIEGKTLCLTWSQTNWKLYDAQDQICLAVTGLAVIFQLQQCLQYFSSW